MPIYKNFIQAREFQLAGSGCSATATSIILKSFNDSYGVAIPSADLNTTNYGTLEPGTDREEIISFAGITTDADGTVTLTTVVRGLQAVDPFTTDATLRKSHAGSTIFVLTNNPQVYRSFFDYADALAIAGAPDASTTTKGLNEVGTQVEVDDRTVTGGTGAILFAPLDKIRASKYHDYAADSVGTDAYAITITPAITTYATGQVFTFKAGTANTGACTLNVSGLGAKTIKKDVSSDLATGDILANQIVMVEYDGTNMQIVSAISGLITTAFLNPIVRTYLNAASPATWTKPAGLKYVVVEVQAAGGNGGSGGANSNDRGSGGGAGGFSEKRIATAALGATETITIGAVGANSSFGVHCSANGGSNGTNSTAGIILGAGGGTAADGDKNITGDKGFNALTYDGATYITGRGASSVLGLGGSEQTIVGGGSAASGFGAGGGGGFGGIANPQSGGAGSPAIVIVTEYYV